jgi:hypothetical protein
MDTSPSSEPSRGVPTYLGGGDPAGRFAGYYPAWIDRLADDVTVEGSVLDGAVQGAEAVRTILVTIRALYDREAVNVAGPWGDDGFVEDYTAQVRGRPIAAVVLVTLDGSGRARHVAAGHRPLSSVIFLSRLLGQRFAGTPYAGYFLAGDARDEASER